MLEVIDGRSQTTPVHISRPRPLPGAEDPLESVRSIVDDVRLRGDVALVDYTAQLDGTAIEAVAVDGDAIAKARSLVRPELLDALEVMTERLRSTSERQLPKPWMDERPDERIGEMIRPLRRIGVYAPGGRAAYPSSVIMAVVPARVAGVEGIAVASPPNSSGEVSEAVLAACSVAGVDEVYRVGGAQAIAALAYGTESVRPVEKIVGPGNVYVTAAKRLVQGWVGIDTDAGPTEIAIVADESASARVAAADLVAQAEHGPHGSHVLITWSEGVVDETLRALELEVAAHPRPDELENILIEGGRAVLVKDLDHALDTVNAFAPEHLELLVEDARSLLASVRNAGAVFVGPNSPVPAGDYVAGTNHVLPSGGTARWSSGLSAADFVKRIYVCDLERSSLGRLSEHIDVLAEAEGLPAHARAVAMRLGRLGRP